MAGPDQESSRWVRLLRPSPGTAARRLVCFPHAGGAASSFVPLAAAVASAAQRQADVHAEADVDVDVDVVAIQYPGRQDRLSEPGVDSIAGLVAAIGPALQRAGWLDRPFALFGHSMGAVVAFEVARMLEHQPGPSPRALFASGRRAPSTWRDEKVHRGGDDRLLQEVARLAGTPAQLLADDDVRQMMLPALRADYKALETYGWEPGPPLRCPIWALVGEADPLTTIHEAAAWASHTSGSFQLRTFPGRHFYLADHLPDVARLVVDQLVSP